MWATHCNCIRPNLGVGGHDTWVFMRLFCLLCFIVTYWLKSDFGRDDNVFRDDNVYRFDRVKLVWFVNIWWKEKIDIRVQALLLSRNNISPSTLLLVSAVIQPNIKFLLKYKWWVYPALTYGVKILVRFFKPLKCRMTIIRVYLQFCSPVFKSVVMGFSNCVCLVFFIFFCWWGWHF